MTEAAFIHETAIVEDDVQLGAGTSVWDNVHVRGPARIGSGCIIGGKSYVAYGVSIGDRVKINSFVYICTGVIIEDGVMISAGATFTNDQYPRATDPTLQTLRPSKPDEHTRRTIVKEGATIGAGAVIGSDLEIGRFSMVGMGSVVTRSVPPFHLVLGNPARAVALLCRCGEPIARLCDGVMPDGSRLVCAGCGRAYRFRDGLVVELSQGEPVE